MKKAIQFFTVFFLLLQIPAHAQSQVLRRAANRLGQKVVEKKIDREIEKKTDEIADSIVMAMERDKPQTEEEKARNAENRDKVGKLLGSMMGGINQADLPEYFAFHNRALFEMEDEKGKTTEMIMHFPNQASYVGYEMADEKSKDFSFVVIDFEQEYVATFSESKGDKQAMSVPLPMDMLVAMADDAEESKDSPDFKKTGQTKTINGYHCEEYLSADNETRQEIWITRDISASLGYDAVIKKMMADKKRMGPVKGEWPSGFPIEIVTENLKNGKKSYMRTKEFTSEDFKFPASEYPYMAIGQ